MHDDDPTIIDPRSSATGILHCLRMLAEEAADLRLAETLRALHEAIAVCQSEHVPENAAMHASPTVSERTRLH